MSGAPGPTGPAGSSSGFTWNLQPGTELTSDTSIIKVGGPEWSAGGYSVQGYDLAAEMSFQVPNTNHYRIAGLSTASDVPFTPNLIDYGWFADQFARAFIIQSGTIIYGPITYGPASTFAIVFDGVEVTYYFDNVAVHSTVRTSPYPLFLAVNLGDDGAEAINVHFGPSGRRGPTGPATPSVYAIGWLGTNISLPAGSATIGFDGNEGTFSLPDIPVTGIYQVNVNCSLTSTVPESYFRLEIRRSGTSIPWLGADVTVTDTQSIAFSGILPLSEGDNIHLVVPSAGANYVLLAGSSLNLGLISK